MSTNKDWEVIINHSDCNVRVGEHNTPKPLNHKLFKYKLKSNSFKRFAKCCAYYESISYDWKPYGVGAFKYFHKNENLDIMTNVLLYYKDEEYSEMSKDDDELFHLHYEKLAKKIKTNPEDYVLD